MEGNFFVNNIILSAVELPGYLMIILLMDIWGRKPLFILCRDHFRETSLLAPGRLRCPQWPSLLPSAGNSGLQATWRYRWYRGFKEEFQVSLYLCPTKSCFWIKTVITGRHQNCCFPENPSHLFYSHQLPVSHNNGWINSSSYLWAVKKFWRKKNILKMFKIFLFCFCFS